MLPCRPGAINRLRHFVCNRHKGQHECVERQHLCSNGCIRSGPGCISFGRPQKPEARRMMCASKGVPARNPRKTSSKLRIGKGIPQGIQERPVRSFAISRLQESKRSSWIRAVPPHRKTKRFQNWKEGLYSKSQPSSCYRNKMPHPRLWLCLSGTLWLSRIRFLCDLQLLMDFWCT